MQTDWKIEMGMVDSMEDPLHNVMHSMRTDSVTGCNTVCYTGTKYYNVMHSMRTDSVTGCNTVCYTGTKYFKMLNHYYSKSRISSISSVIKFRDLSTDKTEIISFNNKTRNVRTPLTLHTCSPSVGAACSPSKGAACSSSMEVACSTSKDAVHSPFCDTLLSCHEKWNISCILDYMPVLGND